MAFLNALATGLANSMFNKYEPTGAYTFEFYNRKGGGTEPLATINLLLAPKSYTIRENYLITTTKTLSGSQISDSGNDFKNISLQGNVYFFFARRPPNGLEPPGASAGSILKSFGKKALNKGLNLVQDAAISVLPSPLANAMGFTSFVTGLQEFYRLRYAVSRVRDRYVKDGEQYFSPIPKGILGIDDLAAAFKGKRSDEVKIVYRDWDDNNHFEVVFNEFQIVRNAEDVNSFTYSIGMTAIREHRIGADISVGDVGVKPQVDSLATNVAGIVNSLAAPFDAVMGYGLTFIEGLQGIRDSYDALTGSDGILQQLVNERKEKFYLVGAKFDKLFNDIDYINQQAGERISENNDLLTNVETTSSSQSERAIEEAGQMAELTIVMNELKKAYATLSNMSPYMSDSIESLQNEAVNTVTDSEFFNSTDSSVGLRTPTTIKHYVVKWGDNAYGLAFRFMRDITKYNAILKLNGLTLTDFDNGKLVGQMIRVPLIGTPPTSKEKGNLIFYPRILLPTDKEREIITYGSDFKLSDQKSMVPTANGDIDFVDGIETLAVNVQDRLQTNLGGLNELHPGWGLPDMTGYANNTLNVAEVFFTSVEQQIEKDPRVLVGGINRDTVKIVGDVLSYSVSIKSTLSTEDLIVQIGRKY